MVRFRSIAEFFSRRTNFFWEEVSDGVLMKKKFFKWNLSEAEMFYDHDSYYYNENYGHNIPTHNQGPILYI